VVQAMLAKGRLAAAAILLLLAVLLARRLKLRTPLTTWFPALVAACYACGMVFVYMATPSDLAWHLSTSVERTMLPVTLGLFASTYLTLESVLAGPDRRGDSPTESAQ
jgi:cytochrome c oxidase assembly factor CtaG